LAEDLKKGQHIGLEEKDASPEAEEIIKFCRDH